MRRYKVALERETEAKPNSEYLLEEKAKQVKVNLFPGSKSLSSVFELPLISAHHSKLAVCALALGAAVVGQPSSAQASSLAPLSCASAQVVSLQESFAQSALRADSSEIVLNSAINLTESAAIQIAQASYHTNNSAHLNKTPVPHKNTAWNNHSNTGGHSNGDWANHSNAASGTGHVNLVHGDFLF